MREAHNPQASIFEFYGEHETGQQLKTISAILDANPTIINVASAVLIKPNTKEIGRNGLTVESIVRAGLLKQMMGLTYEELSFYLQDSVSYSTFARIDHLNGPSKTCLQSCISKIDATTWEAINRILLADSAAKGIEKGRMVRIDSTVTESNIHEPTDSSLLWDCVRVMVRQLYRFKDILTPETFYFCDRSRAAKKRMNNIAYMRGMKKKVKLYQSLLKHTKETRDYLQVAVTKQHHTIKPMIFIVLEQEARTLLALTEKIISQTERRVLNDEKVPIRTKFLVFLSLIRIS